MILDGGTLGPLPVVQVATWWPGMAEPVPTWRVHDATWRLLAILPSADAVTDYIRTGQVTA
jgi:hypothetical protein